MLVPAPTIVEVVRNVVPGQTNWSTSSNVSFQVSLCPSTFRRLLLCFSSDSSTTTAAMERATMKTSSFVHDLIAKKPCLAAFLRLFSIRASLCFSILGLFLQSSLASSFARRLECSFSACRGMRSSFLERRVKSEVMTERDAGTMISADTSLDC